VTAADHSTSSIQTQSHRIVRSRIVVPVAQPPIENGAVKISGDRVAAVGRWQEFARESGDVMDLGDSILLPGLVNAHCHLDYTNMAGKLPPQKAFTDWIKLMLAAKAEWNYTEFAESWINGAQMLLRTGTTTVADFEAVPELLPDVWNATPLRVISLLELTGVKSRRSPQVILQDALDRIDQLPKGRSFAGLAPHAPYSTAPELIRLTSTAARERRLPFSIHVAESDLEFEMFARARGEMFEWLRRNGRDHSDCGLGSPVQHLERHGALGGNLLAVHLNYLAEDDAALLAAKKVSVAHCPRSHFYFQHAPFPFAELTEAGVNVCLGTDSLATVYKRRKETVELNLFDEMKRFAEAHPGVAPEKILQMATINGARALGLAGQIGELNPGAFADLISLPFSGKLSAANEAILQHSGPVASTMIAGEWISKPFVARVVAPAA
jgi:cytosine/adenosine deaminase-related metal-dependent hydrolase